jgi:hypothetical protein
MGFAGFVCSRLKPLRWLKEVFAKVIGRVVSDQMTIVRQLFAAVLAASLVWTGSAGAAQAHTHEIDEEHGRAIHALAPHIDFDHHTAVHGHDYHHDHDTAPANHDDGPPSDPSKPDHDKGVFHVHSLCHVALEAQYPPLTRALAVQVIESPLLVVSLNTRSITPDDRPPRSFL